MGDDARPGRARILEIAHGRRTVDVVALVAPDLDAVREALEIEAGEARATTGVRGDPAAPALLSQLRTGQRPS